jgi:hypothetical protein
MNLDIREKGIVFRLSPAAKGPPPRRCPLPRDHRLGAARCRGSGGRKSGATMTFSSMSWFSILLIDVDVQASETSENPMQSFEIHNVLRSIQLLAR